MKPAAADSQVRPGAAKRKAAPAPAPAPKVSKDELRAQVEKLERSNATLRTKSREAGRTGKAAAARIEELEQQVARLEKRVAAAKPRPSATSATPARGGRRGRASDEEGTGLADAAIEAPAPRRRKVKDALAPSEGTEAVPEQEQERDDDEA